MKAILLWRYVIAGWRYRLVSLLSGMVLIVLLMSCDRFELPQGRRWEIYRNSRYHFEFPYPGDWVSVMPPANQDGQAFVAPDNAKIEVRGWASQISLEPNTESTLLEKSNFQTAQGLAGRLEIEIGMEESSMNLTLIQDQVVYNWRGRSPSDEFADYYQLFNYSANEYRVRREEEGG